MFWWDASQRWRQVIKGLPGSSPDILFLLNQLCLSWVSGELWACLSSGAPQNLLIWQRFSLLTGIKSTGSSRLLPFWLIKAQKFEGVCYIKGCFFCLQISGDPKPGLSLWHLKVDLEVEFSHQGGTCCQKDLRNSVQEHFFFFFLMVFTFYFLLHFPFFSPPCFLNPGANKLDYHLL